MPIVSPSSATVLPLSLVGKWTPDCVQSLAGRDVWILEDNDEAGRKRAREAAEALHGTAKTIRIVQLPGLPDKGDVSDWLDADRRNADKLVDVCGTASVWQPTSPPQASRLKFIDLDRWDSPVPERLWSTYNRFPLRQDALLSGEGAVGKSIVLLQLCAAHVLAHDWLGALPEPGPAIYIGADDDEDELGDAWPTPLRTTVPACRISNAVGLTS
jgi:AAA domain